MILYPAIDIRGGRCVRLVEGDFDRETAFDSDPSSPPAVGSRPAPNGCTSSISTALSKGDRSIARRLRDPRRGRRPDPARRWAPPADRSRRAPSTPASTARSSAPPLCAIRNWSSAPSRAGVTESRLRSTPETAGWRPMAGWDRPMPAPLRWHSGWLKGVCAISSTPTFDATERSPARTWMRSTSWLRTSTRTSLPPAALRRSKTSRP